MAKSLTPERDAVIARYLNEAYGKEKQLETALAAQIKLASRPQLKKGLKEHLAVTKAQARGLKKRIKELGGSATDATELPGPGVITEAASGVASVANRAVAAAKGPMQALRGTSAIRRGRSSALGSSGPANRRRISVAAERWKISPGRSRTTRMSGWVCSKASRRRSTSALWRA
jgi:hypothetical protein